MTLLDALLVSVSSLSAFFDLKIRKIPNWLVAAGALCGVVLNGFSGMQTLYQSLGGLIVGVGVLLIPFAGAEGSLRVRLGNFAARDEAERQLRTFKQEGMNGIVVSLPQAFRPIARTSMP
ncbi:MAG: SPOR domain-containing protein [Deltaproteobacteria bacterium]|nr:SPOR domain-containing protein [Deltaproteobacteria bacterium]